MRCGDRGRIKRRIAVLFDEGINVSGANISVITRFFSLANALINRSRLYMEHYACSMIRYAAHPRAWVS